MTRFLARPCPTLAAAIITLALMAAAGPSSAAPAAASRPRPQALVIVDGDTITTADVAFELDFMKRLGQDLPDAAAPKAADVLRRLVQNQLLVHEGLRMGLQEDFLVTNQVKELVRTKSMTALLDSVALTVPQDTPEVVAVRTEKIRAFVQGLYRTYGVTVDSTLLASLDFASTDPAVANRLRESEAVLATVPTGQLKVKGLAKVLRFKAFHGLAGKADAPQQRDRYFREWIEEALLTYEAQQRGFADKPEIREMARRLQQNLVREQSINTLLNEPFEPTEAQVETFYRDHLDQVTLPPRVMMESVKLAEEQPAWQLREQWLAGAKLDWLSKNIAGVIEGPPPFPPEWIEPEKIALSRENLSVGMIPDPYGVPGGWVVGRVAAIEEAQPIPLADCRDRILDMMKGEFLRTLMADITSRLEAAADIRILPGAEERVAVVIQEMGTAE